MQMVALTYLSVIRFSGSDASDFLHNQLSADVNALKNGDSTFACYCEPKGRVLALMLVGRSADDYYVMLASDLAVTVTERLKIYRMRSKVTIEVLNDCRVSGVLEDDAEKPASKRIHTIRVPDSNRWLAVSSNSDPVVSDRSLEAAWKHSEIQRGICWLGTETSAQFLPQMLGFDQLGAVNYRKGCYPGQEIVARTHYLGKVKRHPRLLNTTHVIAAKPFEKIRISSDGESHDALVVDSAYASDGNGCWFVVSRMPPDLKADQVEYNGELTSLD